MKTLAALAALLFVIATPSGHCAENYYEVTLYPEEFRLEGYDFNLVQVRDIREDTSGIGVAQVGAFNRRVPAVMTGGVSKALQHYLEKSLPQNPEAPELRMYVQGFQISELTALNSQEGTAKLRVRFDIMVAGNATETCFAEAFINEYALDVTKGHEHRIKYVIKRCLEEFVKTWQERQQSKVPALSGNEQEKDEAIPDEYVAAAGAHSSPAAPEDIILNKRNPRYGYDGVFYPNLRQLRAVLKNTNDAEVTREYLRFANTQFAAGVAGGISGFIVGFPIGSALVTGVLYPPLLGVGLFGVAIAAALQHNANKKAEKAVELFNERNDRWTR